MTDLRPFEDQQVQRLLSAAAEVPGSPGTPGNDFVARARRRMIRRRTATGAGIGTMVLAIAVAIPALVSGMSGQDELTPVATPQCVQTVAHEVKDSRQRGFQAVYGQVRSGSVAMSDGITQGSAFRFQIDGTLTGGSVLSPGSVLVWYPVSEVQLPRPGRHVLLVKPAERPATNGQRLFEFTPETVLPLDADGRVQLTCTDGKTGTTELDELRTALAGR